MASKKTKKKSSAKPAKKTAKKKAPARQAAKKAAPKKAAPKKAAAKKAAAKKAAPKKQAAAKKPVAAKQPAPKKSAREQIEVVEGAAVVEMDAMEAKPTLQAEILAMARQLYGDRPDAELLALDPNSVEATDPSMFYELIAEKYGVEADPDNENFGGFGGPISKLIAFVESRWDGNTRKDTPMPPGDWLEEHVYPDS